MEKWAVIFLQVLPNILYIPVNFLASWCYAKFNISFVLRGVAILQLAGSWLRVLSFPDSTFWVLMVGIFL